jgi:hypothetical protein
MERMSEDKPKSPACWMCETELIWGGDHDDETGDHLIATNYSCPNCKAFYLLYWGEPEDLR